MARSNCNSFAVPASTETAIVLDIIVNTMIAMVPDSNSGGLLKARMYPMPIIVPGTA